MCGKLGELIGSGEGEGNVVALLIEDGVVVCCNVGEECVDGMLRGLDRKILGLTYAFASEQLRLPLHQDVPLFNATSVCNPAPQTQ